MNHTDLGIKEQYQALCKAAPDLPLFLQDWYLDAVCQDGNWSAVLVHFQGKVIGAMPFFQKKKWGMNYVAMPVLGKFMGPYLLPEYRNHDHEVRCYRQMLDQMPKYLVGFEQDMHYGVTNWLPFFWRGFRQTTRYSYMLDLTLSEETLLQDISKNYKKKIKKASLCVEVVSSDDIETVFSICSLSFKRQGLSAPYQVDFIRHLYQTLKAHHSCQCFLAKDVNTGAIHSANLLVWDKQRAYYLLGGDDPSLRASGSGVLLQWEAIRYTQKVLGLPIFDFEGSMIPNIEMTRREFGARQIPYFRIQQEWSFIWKWAKRILR